MWDALIIQLNTTNDDGIFCVLGLPSQKSLLAVSLATGADYIRVTCPEILHGSVVNDIWGTSFGIMPVTHDLLISPVALMMNARPLCCINITQTVISYLSLK